MPRSKHRGNKPRDAGQLLRTPHRFANSQRRQRAVQLVKVANAREAKRAALLRVSLRRVPFDRGHLHWPLFFVRCKLVLIRQFRYG
jgi:hypothetical protein